MWDEDVGLAFIFSDKLLKLRDKYWLTGGEGGIRTLGTRKGTTVFETAPFDHSGTSPRRRMGRPDAPVGKEGRRLAEGLQLAKPLIRQQ